MRALALALLVLLAGSARCAEHEADDEEGDSAAFMVVVRREDGAACGAALVSLRTALSAAACARGAELWAAAAGAPAAAARRVLRVALAAGGDAPARAVAGDPWAGADGDLALLELAAPLPRASPILMATDPADCAPPRACHLVRLDGARLRIVDAALEEGDTCAARGPRWAALRARALCLAGPELCRGDRGTGAVCGGKLCGVVSRSAGAAGGCGDAHAAASLPRWRRFLHCAHTRGACGRYAPEPGDAPRARPASLEPALSLDRDGDCARLCTERWLAEAPPEAAARAAPPAHALRLPPAADAEPARTPPAPPAPEAARSEPSPARTEPATSSAALSAAAAATAAPPAAWPAAAVSAAASPLRPAFEFEPNRADFKMSAASTRVFLKAGEYGDNAADYAAPDDGRAEAAPPAALAAAPEPTAPAAAPAPTAPAAAAERSSPAAARRSQPRPPAEPQLLAAKRSTSVYSLRSSLVYVLYIFLII